MKSTTLVQKFKNKIGNNEIFVLRGKFIPLFIITDWLRYYDDNFKNKDEGVYPLLTVKKDNMISFYLDLTTYLNVSKQGIQRYINNPDFKEKTTKKYEEVKQLINEQYEKFIFSSDLQEIELIEELKKTQHNLHEIVAISLFIDFLDSKTLEQTYNENNIVIDFKKMYEVSELNDFESFDIKNNHEIIKWKDTKPKYLKFIYTGYSAAPTTKEVEEKISNINIEEIKEEIQVAKKRIVENKSKKEELSKHLSNDEKNVVEFLSWISHLRDERKALMNKVEVIMYDTISKLYKQWDIDEEVVKYSYAFDVIKGKEHVLNNKESLMQRKNNFINIYYGNDQFEEIYTDLEGEFQEAKSLEKPRSESKEIKGRVASKGVAKGTVKVILDPSRIHSFMEGDILVTSMTRPEFVPLMKKAAAIITNEGGITCHAAIVSRELKKPCIIGTQNATEVLQDGDEVEVNANTGVITIL